MANDVAGRPWVLDTQGSSPIWKSWIKIAHVEYTGYGAAGNLCILQDMNGRLIWQAKGLASLEDQDSFKIGWVQGLIPKQIDGGGSVLVYIE